MRTVTPWLVLDTTRMEDPNYPVYSWNGKPAVCSWALQVLDPGFDPNATAVRITTEDWAAPGFRCVQVIQQAGRVVLWTESGEECACGSFGEQVGEGGIARGMYTWMSEWLLDHRCIHDDYRWETVWFKLEVRV